MKRILFTLIPERGHINPYIGVAAHLREEGHEIAFHAARDISDQLGRAGFNTFLGGAEAPPPPDIHRGALFAEKIQDRAWLRGWIKELLVDRVPRGIDHLQGVVREYAPDVIVTDPMVYEAAITAELEGTTWAAVSNSMNPVLPDGLDSELLRTVRWLAPERDALLARHGLNLQFRGCDILSPHLTVAFTTGAFAGWKAPDVCMVGPSIPEGPRGDECPFPWEALRGDVPIIYMSLGSQIYYQPRMFRTVLEAIDGKPVQVVLSVNELLGSDALGPMPENALAVHSTPQLDLLRRVRAMITHGGANSVMEALALGVPLLISPICNDQFHQVHFIERSGVGASLNLQEAAPVECWNVLQELIEPGSYRTNAARVAASYAVDGARRAADLIAALGPAR